jgi:hypothetical protein
MKHRDAGTATARERLRRLTFKFLLGDGFL